MNKQDLVLAVHKRTKRPKALIEEALDAAWEEIGNAVAQGEEVTLMGFGTFFRGKRKAGKGFNPHTGKPLEVPEILLPKFRAGKAFKEKLAKNPKAKA